MKREYILRIAALAAVLGGLWPAVRAQQYEHEWSENGFHLLELREEGGDTPLFTIMRIEYKFVGVGQLTIYVNPECREAVREALANGQLVAEIADGQGCAEINLSLYQNCRCSGSSAAYGSVYTGQLCEDRCGAAGVEEEEYYFKIFTSLDPGTDLAIGLDPTQLWLIERQ